MASRDELDAMVDGAPLSMAQVIGMQRSQEFHRDVARHYLGSMQQRLPVVSVGCGNGVIEGIIRGIYTGRKTVEMIGVDPAPNAYSKADPDVWETISLQASFPSTAALIGARPRLVGNCVLWLIWPPPFGTNFDAEAIDLLKPAQVVISTDLMGK